MRVEGFRGGGSRIPSTSRGPGGIGGKKGLSTKINVLLEGGGRLKSKGQGRRFCDFFVKEPRLGSSKGKRGFRENLVG